MIFKVLVRFFWASLNKISSFEQWYPNWAKTEIPEAPPCSQTTQDNQPYPEAQGCLRLCCYFAQECFQHSHCIHSVSGITLYKDASLLNHSMSRSGKKVFDVKNCIIFSSFLPSLVSSSSMENFSTVLTRANTLQRSASKFHQDIIFIRYPVRHPT